MDNNDYDMLKNIETRLKTTMIGSLAKFEEYFGHLWEDNNSKRLEYERLWDDTRNAILNNGNNQIRLALDELYSHFISKSPRPIFKEKYRYKFNFNNDGDQK
jgi:hypothetical protein